MSDSERTGTPEDRRLVGTWRLLSWIATDAEGEARWPFGKDAVGYVVYTADRRMITTISRAGRASIGGELLSAPEAGRAQAFSSFVAYSGRFRVEGDSVFHDVEMSLFPDWVGSAQLRQVELRDDGAELVLRSVMASAGGGSVRHELRWERVDG